MGNYDTVMATGWEAFVVTLDLQLRELHSYEGLFRLHKSASPLDIHKLIPDVTSDLVQELLSDLRD